MVTFTDVVTESLLRNAVCNVAALLDYDEKNEIWSFAECESTLTYSLLFSIIANIHDASPLYPGRTKTAIVTNSALNSSLSSIFSCKSGRQPYAIRIFNEFEEAESWVMLPAVPSAPGEAVSTGKPAQVKRAKSFRFPFHTAQSQLSY